MSAPLLELHNLRIAFNGREGFDVSLELSELRREGCTLFDVVFECFVNCCSIQGCFCL